MARMQVNKKQWDFVIQNRDKHELFLWGSS
jgi:hypothetical protein